MKPKIPLLIGLVVLLVLSSACTNPPKKSSLEEVTKFCEDEYNGTLLERPKAPQLYFCKFPNGVECEMYSLYAGDCFQYKGREEIYPQEI